MASRTSFPFSFFFNSIMPNNPILFSFICNYFWNFFPPNSRQILNRIGYIIILFNFLSYIFILHPIYFANHNFIKKRIFIF
jgi:hypothetical protein